MKTKNIFLLLLFLFLSLIITGMIWLSKNQISNPSTSTINQKSATPQVKSAAISTATSQSQSENSPTSLEIKIPILMYHYIRDYNNPDDQIGTNLSVSPSKFEEQLKWLKENGYQTVDFNYLDKPYAISYKPIILTFDDGYADVYTNAFPLLKKYGFLATFYIITQKLGKDNYLNWDQILELKNAGMTIGSHSVSHPDLTKISAEQLEYQLQESKKILETKLNVGGETSHIITDFCYPAGKYNDQVIAAVKAAGYQTATTVKSGTTTSQDTNFYQLPRIRMTNQTDLSQTLL